MATSDQFYASVVDMFNIYGEQNIIRWSDTDNSEVLNEGRVNWALEQANVQIDGRLTESVYDEYIPFGTVEDGNVPPLIKLMAATLAGLMLFDTRRVIDTRDSSDQISQQRKNYNNWIGQIFRGQLKLRSSSGVPLEKSSVNVPFNVEDETGN